MKKVYYSPSFDLVSLEDVDVVTTSSPGMTSRMSLPMESSMQDAYDSDDSRKGRERIWDE